MGERGALAVGTQARDRRSRSVMTSLPAEPMPKVKPTAPRGLRKRAKDLWTEIWASPVSYAWDTSMDLAAVERYVIYFNEWLKVARELEDGSYLSTGSQGQDVMAPAVAYSRQLESQMTKLENQLGLTPMSRARLGLTLEEAKLTAEQVNQMMGRRRGSE